MNNHRSEAQPGDVPQSWLDRSPRLSAGWMLVGSVFLLQWATFVAFADREITWAYPGYFDQSYYLGLSYKVFEQMLSDGLWTGLWAGVTAQVPQGNLLHPQAALLYLLRGPSRLSALTANWLYMILLEFAIVYTLRWLRQRWSVALLGLALVLTTKSRFEVGGGLMDFRPDFGAFCLYGVLVCAVVRSNLFKSLPWSVAVGAVMAWTVLFRHLTGISIALMMLAVLGFVGVGALSRSKNPAERAIWIARARNILISGAVALLLAAPTLWTTRQTILDYYGQITTTDEGRIRLESSNASDISNYLLFYPRSLVRDHLGKIWLVVIGLISIAVVPVLVRTPRTVWRTLPRPRVEPGIALFFLSVALLAPLAILSAFPARSNAVGNVLVPPVIGGILAMVIAFGRLQPRRRSTNMVLACLATLALSAGVYRDLSAFSQRGKYSEQRDDIRQLGEFYDEIGAQSMRWGWSHPRLAFDRSYEYLQPYLVQPWFYERHGAFVEPIVTLGRTILSPTPNEALTAISSCDFVVLTDPSSPDDPGFQLPYAVTMKALYPRLLAAAEEHLVPIRHLEAFSKRLTLYMRVPIRLEGVSGGWITSNGFDVISPGTLLRHFPTIELRGQNTLSEDARHSVRLRARLAGPGEAPRDVAATITFDGPEYTLLIHLNQADIQPDRDAQVKILFDRYAVPEDTGASDGARQRVIAAPTQLRALRN